MEKQYARPRAVICDVDGTLLDGRQSLPTPRTLDCLARARAGGALVIVATGRVRQLVPAPLLQLADYCVCGNGGAVLDAQGQTLSLTPFAPDLVEELSAFCDRVGGSLSFSFLTGYGAYCGFERMREMYLDSAGMDGDIADESARRDRHLRETPFSAFLVADERRVYSYLRRQPRLQAARQWTGCFDVYPAATNKAAGVSRVLQRCGLEWKDVLAFGDSTNDLELLAAAGRGYAMGNACPEAKGAAAFLAPPVWEDGVARVMEQVFGWDAAPAQA